MGLLTQLARALGLSKRPANIIVIGLDNSGKTTLINHLRPRKGAAFEVTPTVGFNVEGFTKGRLRITCFDMSGQEQYRSLWEQYYRDIEAVIFVIDSTDKLRMCVAKDELHSLLRHADIRGRRAPVLFFANKMDLASAASPVDVMEMLGLEDIKDRPWHITASNALSGEGVDAGVLWLTEQLERAGGK